MTDQSLSDTNQNTFQTEELRQNVLSQSIASAVQEHLKQTAPVDETVPVPEMVDLMDSSNIDLEKDKGVIRTPGGLNLPFERSNKTMLYLERLRLLINSMNNRPPLPTQILFPKQDPAALKLIEDYVAGVRSNLKILERHGLSTDINSYAFRLPHMLNEKDWVNIVVRLQFASSLYAICNTLNENLSKDAAHQWGVLQYDEENQYYHINGDRIDFGTRVDVFTIEEKTLANVEFTSQEVLNCKSVKGETLPVFCIPLQELENLDAEAIGRRSDARIGSDQHLMGTDAWSFLHGLLYRIADEEEVIDISTTILSKEDRDPEIDQMEYLKIGNMLQDQDLPYGFNMGLIVGLRDYYCKNINVFKGFAENVRKLYQNPDLFRKNLLAQNLGDSFTVENIHAVTFLLDGKSKLLRLKLVMMDGTTKNAVTVTRPLNMTNLGTFARFNSHEMYFQEIEYIREENKARSFLDRVRGTNKQTPINLDNFKLVEGNPIQSENVLGFVIGSAKAYYFDEESNLEKDDKFGFFHQLRKSFKTFSAVDK